MVHDRNHHDKGMPDVPVIKKANMSGVVSSIPVKKPQKTQFQFRIESINGKDASANVLLSCYRHCPDFHAGQSWSFIAKLKRPRNYKNPAAFDYERFLKAKHIGWTGYIRAHTFVKTTNQYWITQYREKAANTLQELVNNKKALGIIQALTLGVTNMIEKNEWDLFRKTGTIHLMVISGAHIGLIAGMAYWLMFNVWRYMGRICLRLPAQKAASLFALLIATCYAVFAGFGVPAQRALIVCYLMLLRHFTNQPFTVWQAWRYALLAVICYEPHSVLMPGFYLSFIAVGILLLVNLRVQSSGFKKVIIIQLACMLGLLPYTLYLFSYGAVNGVIANLFAVPFVGFVVIPLSMVVIIINQVIHTPLLISLLTQLIDWLLFFLKSIDSISMMNINMSLPSMAFPILISMGLFIIFFVPVRSLKIFIGMILILALKPKYESVSKGDLVVDLLDVGQGLSVVLRTANHIVLYDTGVKFHKGGDMGQMVIQPYLKHLGIHKLDKIIVSHSDLDHRGGLQSLRKAFKVDELVFDNPQFYKAGVKCHTHEKWRYDEVDFEFLPMSTTLKGKNNQSCILKVSNQTASILLTGDVEKRGEKFLVKTYGNKLKSDVLLIPHHSSKSSSSIAFVKAVSPKYALSSYGFDNRYRFPHAKTVNTYKQLRIPVYDTASRGLVRVLFRQGRIQIKTQT